MKLIWSPQAEEDLNHVVDLIAADKKEAAFHWARIVEKKVARLKQFPKSGRIVPEVRRPEIREILVGDYRVIYKISDNINVLTVFHGSKSSLPGFDEN